MDKLQSKVLENFKEISRIPRCSGNEKGISNFIKEKLKRMGLNPVQDEFNNIYVKKEASPGSEDKRGVILQGHMDMVCEKACDSDHDFDKDPIDLLVDGDNLYANKTTLGADDGIGVAMSLAILEEDIRHPEIEVLITTSEETGMDGARGFDKKTLTGRYLINIDSEEEGVLTASCSGGIEGEIAFRPEIEKLESKNIYKLRVSGLKGGHSGAQINRIHTNAIKLFGEILEKMRTAFDYKLIKAEGGTKHNAIPNQAQAILSFSEDEDEISEVSEQIINEFVESNLKKEPDIEIKLEKINENMDYSLSEDSFRRVLNMIQLLPHGINTMMKDLDIPESSDNLAIFNADKDQIKAILSIRSSNIEKREELMDKVENVGDFIGAKVNFGEGYPGWEFKEESELRDILLKAYKEVSGKDMEVTAIHAGLECGLFVEEIPDLDAVSIGPDLHDIHTYKERLSISSAERVYESLKKSIEYLA